MTLMGEGGALSSMTDSKYAVERARGLTREGVT